MISFEMLKSKHKAVKQIASSHTVRMWQNGNLGMQDMGL